MDDTLEPRRLWRRRTLAAFLALFAGLALGDRLTAKDKADYARELHAQLVQKVMPYWLETIDAQHGGYLLADDVKGRHAATEKQVVTQARMIWGFSTAHEKGLSDAHHNYLKAAENGYHFLLDHFLDPQYGGYYWKTDLAGALHINATWFYPPDPGQCAFHRHPDWSPVTDPRSPRLSYGHNVEFAWLMIHAERVLKQQPSWKHFDAIMDHALKYGYDHERGGLYSRGFDDRPATETEKVWWVQAEMLAALADGLRHEPKNAAYSKALDQELHWLVTYQINPPDGIWLESVNADGTPKNTAKAHSWKGAYHDVRGIVKFIEAFGSR